MPTLGAPSSQGGFTMVELIACIVVIGVLTAIAAPSFFDHRAFVARGYADDVASSLRYARRIAVASDCRVQVTVNAVGYSAWQQTTCNSGGWTTPVLRADGTPLNGATPSDVSIPATTVIQFVSGGAAATGSTAINIGTHVVSVDGASGRVSLK